MRQKSSPCPSGTFGGRTFTIDGSTSPTIHSRSAFAVGLADCATKRLKPSSVIVITDCTPPLVSTAAWLRSCSGTNRGTVSVRSPRMRQTSLATIHLRPPLANTWTGDGLMPLTLKVTLAVAWIAVEGIMPLTPWVEQDDHNDLLGSVVGVDGPRRHRLCQSEVVVDLRQRRPFVNQISRIGMDTSKHVFQLHGVNAAEVPVLRKKLRRKEMVAFFEKLAPTVIAIEACGASHHWARLLQSFGHTVKLIPPQLVKPYVKRGKNDAADAEALCEAMSRPTMRFVPVKTAEQQAALMLVGVRDRLIRNRTQLANAIRGYAA